MLHAVVPNSAWPIETNESNADLCFMLISLIIWPSLTLSDCLLEYTCRNCWPFFFFFLFLVLTSYKRKEKNVRIFFFYLGHASCCVRYWIAAFVVFVATHQDLNKYQFLPSVVVSFALNWIGASFICKYMPPKLFYMLSENVRHLHCLIQNGSVCVIYWK